MHLVLCLRCCDCTLLLPQDICISWLWNKCCTLSGSCSSLGHRGWVGGASGLLFMSPVCGLGLPGEAPYGMNVSRPLPVASRMRRPKLAPRAGVGRVSPPMTTRAPCWVGTVFNAVFTRRRRARGMFPGCPGDLRYGEEALHKPAVGTGIPGWSLFGLSTPSPSTQMGCLPEAWGWAAASPLEWGAHFCLLHPLAPVGAIAVWGLLGGLTGTEGHYAGLLGLELEWG